MNRVLRLFGLLSGLLAGPATMASHIAGGNIEMVALDKPGQFRLSLNLYIDDASKSADAVIDPRITVSIFRQRDHQLMTDVPLAYVRRLVLVYANPACARTRGLETSEVRYTTTVQLDPARYDDPAGYYVVWEKCCRNSNVVNVIDPQASGMIYYLSFPALLRNGTSVRNSSPVFLTPNAEYICVNKPFSLAFRATDPDGDELRYSLVTPYNDNIYKPFGFANSPNSPPYRLLRWAPGFLAQAAITGAPALSIGAQSGVLTVRPDRLGLFVFTVLCEEFRGGVKIGEVRRDHQILVVDCAAKVPPKPGIAALDPTGTSPLEFCAGSAVLLRTDTDTLFNYQWRRDGYNLPGQTKPVLRTTDPGEYSVIKSFIQICTRDSVSDVFTLTVKPSPRADITAPDTILCPTRPLTLTANAGQNLQYQWQRGHVDIAGATAPTYTPTEAGPYRLKLFSPATGCTALDSVQVRASSLQRVSLTGPAGQSLCAGVPLSVSVTTAAGALTYVWQRNGTPLATPTGPLLTGATPGDYVVTVSDTNRCAVPSAALRINPKPQPRLDSLPPFCGPSAAPVRLTGTPAGGQFSGPGVTADRFDPAAAGPGRHRVRYVVTNAFGCAADTSRFMTVLTLPTVDLGPTQRIPAGGSITLNGPTGPGLTYEWEPDPGGSVSASLRVRPSQTTPYRLTVRTNGICPVSGDVVIEVQPGLFVPTAFSPNGDGTNDTWALIGADQFPDCQVRVYNRWGEVIFQANPYRQPWDGHYGGQRAPAGVYQYVIQATPNLPEQTGSLTIF